MTAAPRRTELADAYEALRAQVTGATVRTTPRGLALLLQSGMPDWMRAWSSLAAPSPPPQKPSATAAPRGLCSTELVRLLTDMAMAGLARCSA